MLKSNLQEDKINEFNFSYFLKERVEIDKDVQKQSTFIKKKLHKQEYYKVRNFRKHLHLRNKGFIYFNSDFIFLYRSGYC